MEKDRSIIADKHTIVEKGEKVSKELNIRDYNNKQGLLFPLSIGDFLKEDDLVHVIDEVVEEIDLSPFYKKISPVGNICYHPKMMIKIWFYGYCTGTYSSRKIEDKLYKEIGFIYLAGMQRADFKAISEFRRRHLEDLKMTFKEVLKICKELGMVRLGNIAIDSKVMKANASAERTYDEEHIEKEIKKYLEEVEEADKREDMQYGEGKRGNELPKDIAKKKDRVRKIVRKIKELKEAKEKLNREKKKKINLTDESAKFQEDKGRKTIGYRAHVAVDGEEQVIVANEVVSDQNDSSQLINMADKVIKNVEELGVEKPEEKVKVTLDAGYYSSKNLAELEKDAYKNKIEVFVANTSEKKKDRIKEANEFDKTRFKYDESRDKVICPAGKELNCIGRSEHRGVNYKTYGNVSECKKCEYWGICTKSERGRHITISEHRELVEKMKNKLVSAEGKKIYEKRKTIVEPTIGNLSYNLGFREFRLRGEKVKGEFCLMCIAHNLLKIGKYLKKTGGVIKKGCFNGGKIGIVYNG